MSSIDEKLTRFAEIFQIDPISSALTAACIKTEVQLKKCKKAFLSTKQSTYHSNSLTVGHMTLVLPIVNLEMSEELLWVITQGLSALTTAYHGIIVNSYWKETLENVTKPSQIFVIHPSIQNIGINLVFLILSTFKV